MNMIIRRLQWAGAQIEAKNVRILIDPIYNSYNKEFFGKPLQKFSSLEDILYPDAVLITHLHSDHFDPDYIIQSFGLETRLFVPKGTEEEIMIKYGFKNVKGFLVDESFIIGDLTITASYSVDGLGDEQVSWIINDKEKTIIHCGDTLWHGYWWGISKKYGPFEAALLPINGAIVCDSDMINSYQPICLTPEQAIAAARLLESKLLIPIHYGSFHNPPIYNETEDIKSRLLLTAEQEKVAIKLLNHGEAIEL